MRAGGPYRHVAVQAKADADKGLAKGGDEGRVTIEGVSAAIRRLEGGVSQ